MSLFDDLAGKLTGTGEGGGLAASVLDLLNNQQGGISGLLEGFQKQGLGHIVSSWIGTGANLPVSAEQLQQVFGSGQIQAFAQKAGIDPQTAGSQLSGMLPEIVDKLTPDGQIPKGDLVSTGMSLLQNLFSRSKSAT